MSEAMKPTTPNVHRVHVRSTHGQPRLVKGDGPGSIRGAYWIYPAGADLELDEETLKAFLADPILQVTRKDAPQPVPRNLVEMPSLADALPKGDQAIAAQPYPAPPVHPETLPVATRELLDNADRAAAARDQTDDEDEDEGVDRRKVAPPPPLPSGPKASKPPKKE